MASSVTDHVDALIKDLQILSESKPIQISAPKQSKKKKRAPEKKKAAQPVPEAEASPAAPEEKEGTISAFHQEGKLDYAKVIRDFGCQELLPEHIEKFKKVTGADPHPLIKRLKYYAHRDFDTILDCVEKGEQFYLYTGRGPSSASMHLGHCVPFITCKYLQDVFDCPMVIQITDDEKFFFKDLTLEQSCKMARDNIKDIISFGFDITKTFIFMDTRYMHYLYPNTCRILEKVNVNKLCKVFGFQQDNFSAINCGQIFYPSVQIAPAFASTFPVQFHGKRMRCLIPCAIDQDPYFRLTRDVCESLKEHKCSTIYAKCLPGLSGRGKMSASDPRDAIFLHDDLKTVKKKIMSAKSGACNELEKHRAEGANLEEDVGFQLLSFFMFDEEELQEIGDKYGSGVMTSSEVKKRVCEIILPMVETIQKNRARVTEEVVDAFMTVRPLQF